MMLRYWHLLPIFLHSCVKVPSYMIMMTNPWHIRMLISLLMTIMFESLRVEFVILKTRWEIPFCVPLCNMSWIVHENNWSIPVNIRYVKKLYWQFHSSCLPGILKQKINYWPIFLGSPWHWGSKPSFHEGCTTLENAMWLQLRIIYCTSLMIMNGLGKFKPHCSQGLINPCLKWSTKSTN